MTDKHIRELISTIDRFHGNELKDRSEASVEEEVRAIKDLFSTHQAFSKLENAVKLILAIEAHPESNVEVVKLSPMARRQLRDALAAAGEG